MARLRLRDRLEHILVAISAIKDYTRGIREDAFLIDPLRIDAVERKLESISEASRHIPDPVKARHPHIPWRDITGVGNILRHDYPRVNPREIWRTLDRDLDPLRETIEAILSETRKDD